MQGLSRDPADYRGPSTPQVLWWLPLVPAASAWVWWLVVAKWIATHAGEDPHLSWNSVTCMSGASAWAAAQGAVALAGLTCAAVAGVVHVRARGTPTPALRRAQWVALVLLIAWIVIVFVLDPRHPLGIYAGCGAA